MLLKASSKPTMEVAPNKLGYDGHATYGHHPSINKAWALWPFMGHFRE
jgi:hypothetical protein